MPLEDRDGVLEESLEGPMELCFAELVRFAGWKRISDFLIEGCVVNVLGLGYHDVSSPKGVGSCPTMTGLCSRVVGGNGTDTVKAMITI